MNNLHFTDREILVTGGTGSFGQVIVRHLLRSNPAVVRVLSRDEAKQDAMREHFSDDRIKFITGDVRDQATVESAMHGVRFVFHAAALKQVPNCERYPMEAIRTNALGSENVRLAALRCVPEAVVALSTDKACSPINAMGLTKALMERLLLQDHPGATRFVCVRYGNVIGSRGSVVPLFANQIRLGKPLRITDPDMTRFLLCLPDAVETALEAAMSGLQGETWVRKMPAATIRTLVDAMAPEGYPVAVVGVRPGEKMHEVLVNEEEMRRSVDRGAHFVIDKDRHSKSEGEYTSKNADRLDVNGLRSLLQRAEMLQ